MKPRSPRTIADLLGAPGPFYRSVSIDRDRHDRAAMRGYVLTPWLERLSAEILQGLQPGSRRRAWRVTGDFGVGKSALALALLRTLDAPDPDQEPLGRLAATLGQRPPRMYPLVLSGSRDGFSTVLARAVSKARDELRESGAAGRPGKRAIGDAVDEVIRLRDDLVAEGRYQGLLVVVDEMGKFLEAAAGDPETGDVFRLQELAEAASRSGDRPLAVVLILHQGMQSYQQDGPTASRTEWAKVAERFDELVFDHPLSHTSELLAAALAADVARIPASVAASYSMIREQVAALGWLGSGGETVPHAAYPLHPASVPVLARFFATYGQNERSLFGFVASEEANGLRAFAASSKPQVGFYGLDRFFDYVSTSFGHRLVARGGAGDWDRIRAVLDGAATSNAVETAVLKTIGILNLLDAPDLIASEASLTACLAPRFEAEEVTAAIGSLRLAGMVFERASRSGLRLWTSHRVDLSTLWSDADRAVPAVAVRRDLAGTLATTPVRPFVLARRHSILTGVTRRFPIRLIPSSALATTTIANNADGAIVAVLPNDDGDMRHAQAWAIEASRNDPTLIVLTIPPLLDLAPTVVDLLRHRWIEANAPVLREDGYAAAEIERRLHELQTTLVDALEGRLGLAGEPPADDVRVYREGLAVSAPPALHLLVSQACDQLYPSGPIVQNELINRHSLTSAAAAARQRLIEAMFEHEADPDLGFPRSRNPPERALHLSVLVAGRIHRERGGFHSIGTPDADDDPLRLRPALGAIRDAITSSGERIAVTDIYAVLAGRNFGVRAGFSPLLLATVLVENRHRIALFERGTYCPKLDAQAFMRILKGPEHFQLQWVALEGVRAEVYHKLAAALDHGRADEGLLAVVAPLVRFAAGLNLHVQRSIALSGRARAVLDVLMRARGPVDLVFADLPAACDLEPFAHDGTTDEAAATAFAERLQTAIAELQACYPSLLDRMRSDLARLLGVTGELRHELAQRVAPMLFAVREQAMRTFMQRISDRVLNDDAWIEALGGALLSKPPLRWLAQDVAVWESRLEEACGGFLRLEATNFGAGTARRNAVRLALTHVDGRERVEVLTLGQETPEQETFVRSILQHIQRNGADPALVIARLAESLLGSGAADRDDLQGTGA